ncbi:hypothetical protein [Algicola sagamiensis]|uniref:hypothetical protein n=1 Tax=Algicola sagamiensis TaxID=163869 RepID=UPI0003634291|nr:hypothetical protein [Algicola sagamiensis]
MNKEQVVSYSASVTTGGVSLMAHNSWTSMEWLTAFGVVAGIVSCAVRVYVDVSAHLDRKRELKKE